ncbi:MAG: heavy metal-binding domain-containing protein [bacterium]
MYKYLIAMLAMFILATAAWAQQEDEPIRCDHCGMFWEKSSTRMTMQLEIDGKPQDFHFESIGCAFSNFGELMENGATEVKVLDAQILDYPSFGTKNEQMTKAFDAWFLVDTTKLKGSMAPWIAAFASKDTAMEMQESMGGELMDHDHLAAYMQGDSEEMNHESHGEMHAMADVYICPCSGGCCDDIQSDKPGECPKCGMQLVKKEGK